MPAPEETRFARAIGDRGPRVEHLVDDRAHRRPAQGGEHLVADRLDELWTIASVIGSAARRAHDLPASPVDAVERERVVRRDVAVAQVLEHELGQARARITEPTAACPCASRITSPSLTATAVTTAYCSTAPSRRMIST